MSNFNRVIGGLLADNGHNIHKAMDRVVQLANAEGTWREKVIRVGAETMVRSYLSAARKPDHEPGGAMADFDMPGHKPVVFSWEDLPGPAAREAKRKFMEQYTLYGGHLLLADATAKDLGDSARQYDASIAGMQRAADFQRAVGKALPAGKKVRDVFKDDALKDMAKRYKEL